MTTSSPSSDSRDAYLISRIKELIAIESTADKSEQLHAAIDVIVDMLKSESGITIERFERNNKPSLLAYYGDTRPEKFTLIFNGHIDVVPGTPDQFTATIKDDKIYGRGTADMKGAAIIMTELFKQYAPTVSYPLGLQIVTDEEVGGFDGTKYQLEQGVRADFTIAGEDIDEDAICTQMRGICWAELTVPGEAAHGGYVWRGKNAVVAAQDVITKLLQHYPIPDEQTWTTTVNVASVTTPNHTFNRIPGEATIRLDMRYIPDDPQFQSKDTVRDFLASISPADTTITIPMFESSHKVDDTDPFITTLADTYYDVTGTRPAYITKFGGADVRFYSERGMPAVTFGLPDNNIHSADEYVTLESITQYATVLSQFLENLDHTS